MGILILGALMLYLLISIAVVISSIKFARKNGGSSKRWGWGAALIMFLIPFWDWLPTVVAHQYYCATEAGFWEYKTLDQWNKENPGVMQTLHQKISLEKTLSGDKIHLDERFVIETKNKTPISWLSTVITDRILLDRETGEFLAKETGVGSGRGNFVVTGGSYKFWLSMQPCGQNRMANLSKQIGEMEGRE